MIIVLNWLILVMTFGLVQVADVEYIDNDTPIVALHNQSLNEIFEDNNVIRNSTFDTNVNEWGAYASSLSFDNGRLKSSAVNTEYTYRTYSRTDDTSIHNQEYYFRFDYQVNDYTNNWRIEVLFRDGGVFGSLKQIIRYLTTNNDVNTISAKTVSLSTNGDLYFSVNINRYNMNSDYTHYDNVYMINLSQTNLTNLTLQDLDGYYDLWKDNIVYDYDYTLNTLDMTHVTIIVGSFLLWTWLYKFLKGVVL